MGLKFGSEIRKGTLDLSCDELVRISASKKK